MFCPHAHLHIFISVTSRFVIAVSIPAKHYIIIFIEYNANFYLKTELCTHSSERADTTELE